MESSRFLCLLCRSRPITRRQDCAPKRYASTKAKAQPYVLSRTVIDLDANDSTYVRRLEEEDTSSLSPEDQEVRRLLTLQQRQAFWDMTRRGMTNPELAVPAATVDRFDMRSTPPDLFSYALQGPRSHKHPTGTRAALRPLFLSHRIHPTYTTVSSTIKRLDFGLHVDAIRTPEKTRIHMEKFWENLRLSDYISKPTQLGRLIDVLSSFKEGCKFLAEHIGDLAPALIRSPSSAAYREKTLIQLNNLSLNMESRGLQLGEQLSNIGLYLAASYGSALGMKRYLASIKNNNYHINPLSTRAMVCLALHMLSPDATQIRKSQLCSILTGWSNDSPSSNAKKQLSFSDIISHSFDHKFTTSYSTVHSNQDDQTPSDKEGDESNINSFYENAYGIYLLVLAELKYSNTLMHEWKRFNGSQSLSIPSLDVTSGHILAFTFLVADERSLALSVLDHVATKISEERAEPSLDLKRLIYIHYCLRGVTFPNTRKKLVDITIPRNSEDALVYFTELIAKYPKKNRSPESAGLT